MNFIDSQFSLFKECLGWHADRIKTFLGMIEGAIITGKTSQTRIASCFDRQSSQKSLQRTIEKFYQFQNIDHKKVAKLIVKILGTQGKMKLSIDRTNWERGKNSINFLIVSVEVNPRLAVPLFWKALDSQGNSDQKERCDLLDDFIDVFGKEAIQSIAGDREFIGEKWFDYLQENTDHFYMRVKHNMLIEDENGREKHLSTYFQGLKERESSTLTAEKDGVFYYYHGKRLKDGEWLFICSSNSDKFESLRLYKDRWSIERTFFNMKTNGFNIEDTHITKLDRLQKLIALVALSLCFCAQTGNILVKKNTYQ